MPVLPLVASMMVMPARSSPRASAPSIIERANPVLHRARRILRFELRVDRGHSRLDDTLQTNHRRVADELVNVFCFLHDSLLGGVRSERIVAGARELASEQGPMKAKGRCATLQGCPIGRAHRGRGARESLATITDSTTHAPLLLLPAEIRSRELDGRLLLGLLAAERGWRVIVGSKAMINRRLAKFPPRSLSLQHSHRSPHDDSSSASAARRPLPGLVRGGADLPLEGGLPRPSRRSRQPRCLGRSRHLGAPRRGRHERAQP